MQRNGFLLTALLLVAACQQPAAPPVETPKAPPQQAAAAPPAMKVQPAIVVPKGVTLPSLDFPPGQPLYVCVTATGKTNIDYEPRVETLCRRHPEMGPCQYERDACRAKGGRVYTQKGEEITMAVEAEYDRVVMRVRFQGDSGAPP